MNGIEQAIAARDGDGAEKCAVDYALECIFGGGHGYERGAELTSADEETCRECAAEALTEYSRRVDGDGDSPALAGWIERVAERAVEACRERIAALPMADGEVAEDDVPEAPAPARVDAAELLRGATPGPWVCALSGDPGRVGFSPARADGGRIADCAWHPEAEANARLIAAAPDLAARVVALEAALLEARAALGE